MNVVTKVENGTLFIELEGRLDTVTSQELSNLLPQEKRANLDIDFNFEKLQYVSSAGLRLLVLFKKEIFSVTGFDKILKII